MLQVQSGMQRSLLKSSVAGQALPDKQLSSKLVAWLPKVGTKAVCAA